MTMIIGPKPGLEIPPAHTSFLYYCPWPNTATALAARIASALMATAPRRLPESFAHCRGWKGRSGQTLTRTKGISPEPKVAPPPSRDGNCTNSSAPASLSLDGGGCATPAGLDVAAVCGRAIVPAPLSRPVAEDWLGEVEKQAVDEFELSNFGPLSA